MSFKRTQEYFKRTSTYEVPGTVDPRTILLLEDDMALAEMLKSSLETYGYRVRHVVNGVDGLKLIMHDDYDLILCDMVMPGFPGEMFYRAVERVRPQLCGRFLFMTGHMGDPGISEFIRKIRGLVIWKPFQMYELLEALKVVLSKPQQAGKGPGQWTPETKMRNSFVEPYHSRFEEQKPSKESIQVNSSPAASASYLRPPHKVQSY